MSSNRRPFDDHGFGQELKDLATAYLDLYGPESAESLGLQTIPNCCSFTTQSMDCENEDNDF